jgi:hypothetical protein
MRTLRFIKEKMYRNTLSFIALIFLSTTVCLAQPGDPQTDPDNPVPIQGILYLLIGGIIVGIKKITGKRDKGQ